MINHVMGGGGLESFQAYFDDIIVYSDDWDHHVKQLHEFFAV